jgi:hypothetical protein
MAKEKTKTSEQIRLDKVRLSFPVLWVPKPFREGLRPRFEATFLLDPTNAAHAASLKILKGVIKQLTLDAYGEIPEGIASGADVALHNNSRADGSQIKKYAGYAGMYYLVTATPAEVLDPKAKPMVPKVTRLPNGDIDYYNGQPPVLNGLKRPVREGQPQYPYGGCYVNALVSFWAQPLALGYGPRINANLLAVQFAGDGESFGRGQVDTDAAFEAVEDLPSPVEAAATERRAAGGFLD